MTDELYERYKEALRTGHVAVLRGQLEAALAAYAEAAEIAPARALPHTSLGGVYLRLGRVEEALAEYAAAVARAANDEGALLGQAEALNVVGRKIDAALALDRVSEIQEAAGRLPEASDTLRRALELDEAPERMRRQRSLQRQIRLSAGDQAAELQLARALRIREEVVPAAAVAAQPEPVRQIAEAAVPEPVEPVVLEPVAELVAPAAAALQFEAAPATESEPAPAIEAPAEIEQAPAMEATPEIELVEAAAPEPVETSESRAFEGFEIAAADPEPAEPFEQAAFLEAVGPASEPATDEEELDRLAAMRLQALNLGDLSILEAGEQPAAADEEPDAEPSFEPEPVPVMAEAAEVDEPAAIAGAAEPEAAGLPIETEPIERVPLETVPLQPSGDALLASAEAAEAVGNLAGQRTFLLDAARAYAREGRFDAGLDAAQRVIAQSPDDVDAHLVLVELYVSRSWDGIAAEKLLLLGRLADLDDDETTRLRLCAAASQAFPGNGRLQALCS